MEITGYNLVRSDHPANTKRGGVCLYYKTCLPLRVLDIQYLNECINFELKIDGKLCTFVALYRSPSQSLDNSETIIDDFELNLETLSRKNPFLLVAIGDFNAKSKAWYCNDNTTSQGKALENVTSQFGLDQVMKEPTHILHNSSLCIDLIFASQPNLIIESGVHPSLHPNCHHQLIYTKFNLQIYYPPQHYREVWHYNDANTELIRRAVDQFNRQKAFLSKNVNEKVSIFNETILNILRNFIPHETVLCDDRDPPWFNNKIKSLIHQKNIKITRLRSDRRNSYLRRQLNCLQDRLNGSIEASKQKYYCRMTNKLTNAEKRSKAYWSILKRFLNNKKIPLIPPLFYENCFVTNFKEKAELFNSLFADQCSLMSNASKLPSNFTLYTDNRLSTVTFSQYDFGKIIQNLNPNKAHGHDNISIRMLKICSSSIYGPLELIFKEALSTGLFPSNWKIGNIAPIHKKGDKQILKNYRPVSLLPICGKIFERLIFNDLFNFLLENNLFSPN